MYKLPSKFGPKGRFWEIKIGWVKGWESPELEVRERRDRPRKQKRKTKQEKQFYSFTILQRVLPDHP